MSKVFILYCALTLSFIGCQGKYKRSHSEKKEKPMILNQEPKIDTLEIDGIWAENINEDANFWIKNDSMYFIEDRNNPLSIKIKNDTLYTYYEDMYTYDIILKLDKDSLILRNEFNKVLRLYKR